MISSGSNLTSDEHLRPAQATQERIRDAVMQRRRHVSVACMHARQQEGGSGQHGGAADGPSEQEGKRVVGIHAATEQRGSKAAKNVVDSGELR